MEFCTVFQDRTKVLRVVRPSEVGTFVCTKRDPPADFPR